MTYTESERLLVKKFGIRNKVDIKIGVENLIYDFIILLIAEKKKKLDVKSGSRRLYEMIPSSISLEKKNIDRLITEIPVLKTVDQTELSWLIKKLAQRYML